MKISPLRLKPTSSEVHAPAAWFIPGSDPAAWIEELSRWEIPMHGMRLLVVPTSPKERAAIGVLVVPPEPVTAGRVLRAQPYGRIGTRLFLPANGLLEPPVSDAELDNLLRLAAYVLHPSAGLVGFEADEVLTVSDLLGHPLQKRSNWTLAVAAATAEPRLLGVGPTEVPVLEQVLESGRDDIGSAVDNPLGPSPDESSLTKLAQFAALPPLVAASLLTSLPLAALNMLSRLARPGSARSGNTAARSPAGAAGHGGALRSFNDWVRQNLSRLSRALLDARARELRRLARMLENDPEEGLRHAIPLRPTGSRGAAPPGWRLTRRGIDFNLARLLGGGGRADPWAMSPETVSDLTRRYRDAATRELSLGRYRRAAYIFAHLLGDFAAAAAALEQGRGYREAALLYRERLNNPSKAAECLEKGGLLIEAAVAYEELHQYEKAGDVYRQLENFQESERCYRTQVRVLLSKRDDLSAARLLESKLAAPDEALAVLHDAWPAHDSTGQCLRETFALLGRLARHEQTGSRLRDFRKNTPVQGREATLVTVLSAVAGEYPESSVQSLAADTTRVVAGRALGDPSISDRASIARAVARLVPRDAMLSRDVTRFLERSTPRAPTKPSVRRSEMRRSDDSAVLRQFHLPDSINWEAVTPIEGGFCAAGKSPHGLHLLRGTWDGRQQGETYGGAPGPGPNRCRLYPVPGKPVVFLLSPFRLTRSIVLQPTDTMQRPLKITYPTWLIGIEPLGLANSDSAISYVLTREAIQSYNSESGALRASSALPSPPLEGPLEMVSSVGHLYVTWGSGILHYSPASPESSRLDSKLVQLPLPVLRLATAGPHVRSRVAAAMTQGAAFRWGNSHWNQFAHDMVEPHLAFTRSGMLIAADTREGRVYRTGLSGVVREGGFASPGKQLLALTPAGHLDEFASFTIDGTVTVFTVPQRM